MSDYRAPSPPLPFVPALIGLLELGLAFGGSSVGEPRVPAVEETLQVAHSDRYL